jgi:hypothetical protein
MSKYFIDGDTISTFRRVDGQKFYLTEGYIVYETDNLSLVACDQEPFDMVETKWVPTHQRVIRCGEDEKCENCKGTGDDPTIYPPELARVCPTCDGTGLKWRNIDPTWEEITI